MQDTEKTKEGKEADNYRLNSKYVEIYRPPGLIKIKESKEVEAEGLSKEKHNSPIKKESYFYHKDPPSFGNSVINKGAEEREREFKDKMEKYIWSCVPDKRLYSRDGT